MKFNKWTLGLAAVGAVSLASAVRADEAKLSALNTALSNTTISGYVDVAAQYNAGNPGKTAAVNQPYFLNSGKVDSFSLNSVTISLDKPLDESPWAAGYHIDLNAGTDAITPLNSSSYTFRGTTYNPSISAFGVRQAYVALRTPVGNGIDWKVGLIDGVTGYESNTGYQNPNYTRSYGYQVNPASFVGMIGSYKVCDMVSVQGGIANRGSSFSAAGQGSVGLSSKDFIAAVALTAPDSWGFLKGSVLNLGTFQGLDNGAINNYSVNATLNTPVAGLKVGFAYDTVESLVAGPAANLNGNIYGVYATYQATQKLGFNLRGEYLDAKDVNTAFGTNLGLGEEITATVQYDLWANVVSRVELRWDHVEHGTAYNANNTESAYLVALNLVYKF